MLDLFLFLNKCFDSNLYDSTPVDPALERTASQQFNTFNTSGESFEVATLAHEALTCPHCGTVYATQYDLDTHVQKRH